MINLHCEKSTIYAIKKTMYVETDTDKTKRTHAHTQGVFKATDARHISVHFISVYSVLEL